MIKNILFATDLGIHTPHLLHHVASLAEKHGAKINVLHVVEPKSQFAQALVGYKPLSPFDRIENSPCYESVLTIIKNKMIDLLEEEFIDGQQGLSYINDVQVIPGEPSTVILAESQQMCADIIVMGSHGALGDKGGDLGSVAGSVLRLSRTPVFMVPMAKNFSSNIALS